MNEPVYEYEDGGTTMTSKVPLYNNYKVGDLVAWTADGDIGIVTELGYDATRLVKSAPGQDAENIYIRWTFDTRASGWHGPHPSLELLSSH
jgi:hypothetical protein|tara:strand:- start:1789 stop:2061 length:273 start_codon:yes stop_codon:yes gene_type:complete